LNVELLSEFFYQFPRELDVRLGRGLSREEVEKFAKEDPRVRGHLEVIRRKELLELVLGKMEGLRELNVEERGRRKADKGKERKGGWSLF
jgi:dynamin-like GTPase MGM1, mitochondrial